MKKKGADKITSFMPLASCPHSNQQQYSYIFFKAFELMTLHCHKKLHDRAVALH